MKLSDLSIWSLELQAVDSAAEEVETRVMNAFSSTVPHRRASGLQLTYVWVRL